MIRNSQDQVQYGTVQQSGLGTVQYRQAKVKLNGPRYRTRAQEQHNQAQEQ